MSVTVDAVNQALATVIDPNTGRDLFSSRSARNVRVDDGHVSLDVELGYPALSQINPIREAVQAALDGRDALAVLDDEEDVDLVVTDIEMPVMDGFALLETVRARPATASLPVVIVSSVGDERARARGAEAGADAWVVKSQFDQRSLLDTVGRLIDLR